MWLTQAQIIKLFNGSKSNISEHIKYIFESEELAENSTVRNFRTVQKEAASKPEEMETVIRLILSVLNRSAIKNG